MDLVDVTSFGMDFGSGQQNPENAFEHAMSDGPANESPAEAAARGARFINDHLQSAANIERQWLTTRSPDKPLYSMSGFAYAVALTSEVFSGVFPDGVGPDTDNRHVKVGSSCVTTNTDPRPTCQFYLYFDNN